MTSMPASRSARAMTLAPRSCPSSPGFAITTRSFRTSALLPSALVPCALNDRYLFVLAPHIAERVAHLTNRRIRANGVEDGRHQVVTFRAGGGAQGVERALNRAGVTRLFQPFELR